MYYFLKKLCKNNFIRLIDLQFAYIMASKNEPYLMFVVAYLSYFISKGNVCLPLLKFNIKSILKKNKIFLSKKEIQLINNFTKQEKNLLGYSIIGNGKKVTPLVIEDNCLYLYRVWQEENIIIQNVINNYFILPKKNNIKKILNILFKSSDIHQKISVAMAFTHKISIITGSPGTGKTNIIAKLILFFIKIYSIPLTIKIVASTGKAANRLTESINNYFIKNNYLITKEEKKNIPYKATTIHRLLKINMYNKETIYNNNNKLITDLLIIDEASMVDLNLMSIILNALSVDSKLILLGDDNQLPPIEIGYIFKDICNFKKFTFTKEYSEWLYNVIDYNVKKENKNKNKYLFLRNFISLLKHNYRYEYNSGINQLATLIRKGNVKKIKNLFLNQTFSDIKFININNETKYKLMINQFIIEYKKYFDYINTKNDIHYIFNIFNTYQILCAVKYGIFGTREINNKLENEFFKNNILDNTYRKNNWYIGRPIIITQNNSFLNLYNGDIGITFLDTSDNELKVKFSLSNGKYHNIIIDNLPKYDIAYAITVHKSQGSEFDNISLVLPNKYSSLLTRELIYTAITRSKITISIYSTNSILFKSIKSKIIRFSNLENRILTKLYK
ncbi:exodeoxyribonuclease V subunit alpha [Enterobacteriaceae endosymbiont of Plateumaris consimilis]|uniref:exodeoxyribonuclease V subunit alpha n=1 Tax=Enterobacteriaceae endosymbiont of Plateumaris consimilis TaxID=2675794 RepID=UPI001449A478|nr:exodeoxyribonuclease V subunit alpha [Enterobacteriaceae endosymbiont of Plateumaris consimilis]QJC28809.1 exodeoxyribonuclease V subunit alpha [Enterobacteriaceae endosymbiont of Plateumaris consimilis]